jgi:predicted transcriptional regulator
MHAKRGIIARNLDDSILLLARHVEILKVVMRNEPIGIIKIAELTKLPEHKVRYSLRILEQEGLVIPSPAGAKTSPKVGEFVLDLGAMLARFKATVDSLRKGAKQ